MEGETAMSGNLATQDNLNSAVSQITSSLEEQAKEVRALEASMVAGFERIDASLDAQNVRITGIAEMVTSRFEKSCATTIIVSGGRQLRWPAASKSIVTP
jgi:hypothetical protein